jgi:hypothetical protein
VQQFEKLTASLFEILAVIRDPPGEPHKHCAKFQP